MLLAGDVGGTKTALALFHPDGGPYEPIAETTFMSQAFDSLEEIVAQFMASVEDQLTAGPITAAAVGVAGPVIDCEASITNLSWTVERGHFAECLKLEPRRVRLRLGAKCGNVALSLMSRGGVYLGGGIPPRILPRLLSDAFLGPFSSKGRFTDMMAQIPVHVITNPKTALLGALLCGIVFILARALLPSGAGRRAPRCFSRS